MIGCPTSREEQREVLRLHPRAQAMDAETQGDGNSRREYMFKGVPHYDRVDDPVAASLLARWTSYGITKALIGIGTEDGTRDVRSASTPTASSRRANVDPNEGMDAVRKLDHAVKEHGVQGGALLGHGPHPAGAAQRQEDVPDLREVRGARHPDLRRTRACPGRASAYRTRSTSASSTRCAGSSPSSSSSRATAASRGPTLMVKLLLKWPNLYYSTSRVRAQALPARHHRLREHARRRQGHLRGLLPGGAHARPHLRRAARRAVPRPRVAQVPARERAAGLRADELRGRCHGTARRHQGHRAAEHRAGAVRGDAALRPGRRGAAPRPRDRRRDAASSVAGFVSPYSVIDRGRRSVGDRPEARRTAPRSCCACASRPTCCSKASGPASPSGSASVPSACRARNPRLVYARMTGWGQDGPLAGDVGHDVNYLSIAGVLWHIGPGGRRAGPADQPARRLRRRRLARRASASSPRSSNGRRPGAGQVVDAAMVDGSAQLMSIFFGLDAMGGWGPRGTNLLDGGAHFYNVYETADGEYVSIASYEPKFYANLLALIGPLGFDDLDPAQQMDRDAVARAQGALRRRCSARARATSGSRSSPGTRCASRRCCSMTRGARAPAQRRARHVRRRRRRAPTRTRARASAARRAQCGARRSRPAPTPTPPSPTGASPPPRSRP